MNSQQSNTESDIITELELNDIMSDISQVTNGMHVLVRNTLQMDVIGDEDCHSSELQQVNINDQTRPTGILPPLQEFSGHHEFKLIINKADSLQCSWRYSENLNQVFIDMNKILMVAFHVKSPVQGMFIRAMPVYSSERFASTPVVRCKFHSCMDDPNGQAHTEDGICCCIQNKLVGHVLQVATIDATYCYDHESERHSVLVPVVAPQPGANCIQVPYIFGCKTSCATGMQRRPIQVIFTLEERDVVLGRQVLSVKICSCPKRDMEKMEEDLINPRNTNHLGKRSLPDDSGTSSKKKVKFNKQVNILQNKNEAKHAKLKIIDDLMSNFKRVIELLEKLRATYE